jgi:phenylpropionate dioxygenase-like ring-hydroxylating dioxygenase large terminal subunit
VYLQEGVELCWPRIAYLINGDFFAHEITGMPIVIVCDVNGTIRAFYNACRHRGMRIALGEGNCRRLTCSYHSWTYATDGALAATPMIEEDDSLQHAALSLLLLRLECWHGFLFVTFDDAAAPLLDWLGDVPENCTGYGPKNMVCTRRVSWDVAANWKLHFEKFNDFSAHPLHPSRYLKPVNSLRTQALHP